MIRLIAFLFGFLFFMFVGWVSGIDIDKRSTGLAILILLSVVGGLFCSICPYLDRKAWD